MVLWGANDVAQSHRAQLGHGRFHRGHVKPTSKRSRRMSAHLETAMDADSRSAHFPGHHSALSRRIEVRKWALHLPTCRRDCLSLWGIASAHTPNGTVLKNPELFSLNRSPDLFWSLPGVLCPFSLPTSLSKERGECSIGLLRSSANDMRMTRAQDIVITAFCHASLLCTRDERVFGGIMSRRKHDRLSSLTPIGQAKAQLGHEV